MQYQIKLNQEQRDYQNLESSVPCQDDQSSALLTHTFSHIT